MNTEPIEIKISIPHSEYSKWNGYQENKLEDEVDDIVKQLKYVMKHNVGVTHSDIMIESLPVIKEPTLCSKCNTNKAESLHTCPYESDIHNDNESWCDCCDFCWQNCADNV
jgi:hypothetical protein